MLQPLSQIPTEYLFEYFVPRLFVAALVGAIVGLERELGGKEAGLKTFILICVGSTLYTSCSLLFPNSDVSRIAAQIVTGVGFIGGGCIFRSHDRVSGLTTAAFIWVIAALGIVIGAGGLYISMFLVVGLIVTVQAVKMFEVFLRWLAGRNKV